MTRASMHLMLQVSIDFCDHLHPITFGKPMFTYRCACQAKVAISVELKLQSQNCKSYWNLEVYARVPRLESNYIFICKMQALYFLIGIFFERPCEGWKLCRVHFCKVPPPKKKLKIWWPKWHLTNVEDFNIEHCPWTYYPRSIPNHYLAFSLIIII